MMSYQTKSPMLHAVIQYSRVDYRFSQVTNTVRYAPHGTEAQYFGQGCRGALKCARQCVSMCG